jgi:hypothetical protein
MGVTACPGHRRPIGLLLSSSVPCDIAAQGSPRLLCNRQRIPDQGDVAHGLR